MNKKAIISGASQGLGAMIADFFVKEGASVVICARDKRLLFEKKAKLLKNNAPEDKVSRATEEFNDSLKEFYQNIEHTHYIKKSIYEKEIIF
jgi:short-subunit dehydrogenase